jgi:5'-methylthioadenosine phosphorylase
VLWARPEAFAQEHAGKRLQVSAKQFIGRDLSYKSRSLKACHEQSSMRRAMPKPKAKASKITKQKSEAAAEIGIIGGSGLYAMPGLERTREWRVRTPFGDPSDALVLGTLEGKRVAFLARHARGHRLLPSEINYRANLYAMKLAGVTRVISVSAVGSLREDLRPLEFLIPDQFFDRTYRRIATFFGDGIVAHVGFDKPTCAQLSGVIGSACDAAGVKAHRGGTYVCIEGPQFSTLAESKLYRSWGMDVIGMTNLQEAKLAREAEICYATLALVTDYDCWHPDHDSVTADLIIATLGQNAKTAQGAIAEAVGRVDRQGGPRACECATALATALVTPAQLVPQQTLKDLAPIIGKYMQ